MLCRRSWLSVIATILLLLEIVLIVESYNYNGYSYNGSYRNNRNNYNNDDGNNDDGGGDDGNNNDDGGGGGDDDYYNDDDGGQQQQQADDYNYNYNNNNNGGNGDDDNNGGGYYVDDWVNNQVANDDDAFYWNSNVGFEGVSIMPVSCINYNNGHMIKFSFFESDKSYQCHFAEIGTFVVSIAHYMRAYFNYQAIVLGNQFSLPGDAGYLNCILLQETAYSSQQLYAKIGCMERETFTSTKLSLHLYTDAQCSKPYDDGESNRRHSTKGYEINGYTFSTHVSFRPPFYTCATCAPDEISDTFNKRSGSWYDDDYISKNGAKYQDSEDNGDGGNDDGQNYGDDYVDDMYLAANDDIYRYNNNGDDYYNGRSLLTPGVADPEEEEEEMEQAIETSLRVPEETKTLTPAEGVLEAFEREFWEGVEQHRRSLYNNNMYNINSWNMCQRVFKYGVWCDEDCRSLDAFRTDSWSGADIILLSIMCTFLTGMMILIVAKRLKAAQKSRLYQEDVSMPGLPPVAMFTLFVAVMTIIIVMAKLKFVNETLVFAVVTCVLLFIYMLKLTLFDTRRPVLLAAARHEIFDNPMDERLFD